MRKTILFSLISTLGFAQGTTPATSQLSGQKYVLDATPKTVAFGYYDAAAKPVLHIHSGDTVEFHTVVTNSPGGWKRAELRPTRSNRNCATFSGRSPIEAQEGTF